MAQSSTGKTVLVAVNPSKHSEAAFDWYCENLHRPDDHVIVYYCQKPLEKLADAEMYDDPSEREVKTQAHKDARKAFVKKYTEKCQSNHIHRVTVKVEDKSRPADRICDIAKQENVSLIIIASRGLGAIRRTLLGAVSDHVVHHCNRPVVIIPTCKSKH